MRRRQLLDLVGESAEIAGAQAEVNAVLIAEALKGKPIDPRLVHKLIDLLVELHVRAAKAYGVGWPQLIPPGSPLREEFNRRLRT